MLLVVLAGCETSPRRTTGSPPPDWELVAPPKPAIPSNALPATTEVETGWVSLSEWSAQHRLEPPRGMDSSRPATVSLSYDKGTFVFQERSLAAQWNGMDLWLGFAPQMSNGGMYLQSLDLQKNVLPLLNLADEKPKTGGVIVIDPGHGGGNTGAQSVLDGRFEKEFTLDWAQRLAPLLRQRGWRVFLTRTDDSELPLGDRVEFAESHKADLFISLHFNASAGGSQQSGIETYCLTPEGLPSSLTREFDDDPALVFPNNAFDTQNLQYAVRLQRAMLEVSGTADRGVRRARFMGVLRGQNRPAVLLEGGYLSNRDEARRIENPQFRQQLAEAIARALE